MHELSIALSILDIATQEAGRRGGVLVKAVYVKLGPLSGVIRDALVSAYDLAREGTPLESSRLVIEEVPLVVRCKTCDADRPVESIQQMCCSQCGTPAEDVISGRELEVTAMEIEA